MFFAGSVQLYYKPVFVIVATNRLKIIRVISLSVIEALNTTPTIVAYYDASE